MTSDTAVTQEPPPKRLRWYQFRLRSLLLLFVLVALGSAWFAQRWERAKRQERMFDALMAQGSCYAFWSYSLDDRLVSPQDESYWPKWLQRLLGPDFFFPVRHVDIGEDPVPEGVWPLLAELPDLWVLMGPFTDLDLERAAATCPNLRSLEIRSGRVTDAGLQHIAKMENLEYLSFPFPDPGSPSHVMDEGLAHLGRLRKLRVLSIPGACITSKGVAYVAEITSLEKLHLACAPIGDSELRVLSRLPRLESLNVYNTFITDEGLRELRNFPSLRSLAISSFDLTPAGLAHLEALPHLEALELHAYDLCRSRKGIEHLKRLRSLRELTVHGMYDDYIAQLAELPELEALTVVEEPSPTGGVTDKAELARLAALPRLRSLDLRRTSMTDKGLQQLGALTTLEELWVPPTCTQAGIARLRKQLPRLTVHAPY